MLNTQLLFLLLINDNDYSLFRNTNYIYKTLIRLNINALKKTRTTYRYNLRFWTKSNLASNAQRGFSK